MAEQKQVLTPEILEKTVKEVLSGKKTLKDIRGLKNEEMEACYTAAYNFYNHGKFLEALNIFTLLCTFDNLTPKYWLGLGATRQMLKDFSGAVEAYSLSALLDYTNPKAPFHAADCLLALKEYDKAKMALEAAISIVETTKTDKKEYKAIAAQAKNLLDLINKRAKEGKQGTGTAKGSSAENKAEAKKSSTERKS